MKQHPILFSTPMVQAILDERKTNTRRTRGLEPINEAPHTWYFSHDRGDGYFCFKNPDSMHGSHVINPLVIKFPWGGPGDVLWVRETWANGGNLTSGPGFVYKTGKYPDGMIKWKPSIHMPKAAARIWLEIVSVRVERLQDISEEDAIAEGILIEREGHHCMDYLTKKFRMFPPEQSFETLWQSINGPESWDANPWVWVVGFKRITNTNN